jgi:hypothetical protein
MMHSMEPTITDADTRALLAAALEAIRRMDKMLQDEFGGELEYTELCADIVAAIF